MAHKLLCLIFTLFAVISYINAAIITKETTFNELRDLQRTSYKECKKDHNIEEGEMDEFFKTDYTKEMSESFKCLLACYGEKLGFINGAKIDWEKLSQERSTYHQDETDRKKSLEIVEDCKNTVKENPEKCELSYQLARCLLKGYKEKCIAGRCEKTSA